MTDPIDVLREAWADYDRAATALATSEFRPTSATLTRETHAKEAAIAALGLNGTRLHELVADCRRRHIAGDPHNHGMPIRDAVTTALLEMGAITPHPMPTIDHTQLKEAS